MSKSLENIIDPLDVSEKYGTDAVRLSLTIGNTAGNDLRLSEEKIGYFRNFTNKLWNISRFILMTVAKPERPKKRPAPATLADRWILGKLDAAIASVTKDIEQMNFSRPGETLRDFTWTDLADWYLEIAKVEGGKDAMLCYLLDTLLTLWHPFMPFVTEEVHGLAFAKDATDLRMVAKWPKAGGNVKKSESGEDDFELIKEVIVAVRNIRATYKVEPGKKIDVVLFGGKKTALLKGHAAILSVLGKIGKLAVEAKGTKQGNAAGAVVGGVQVFAPLGSLVDADAERKRLDAELAEAEKYAAAVEARLGNDAFVSRAPAHVVAAERQKLADAKEKAAKLGEQRKALG